MFQNLSLRIKLFALVSTVVVATFLALTTIVTNRSVELAKNDAFNLAQETADKYSNQIRADIQGARITAETLATVFSTLKDHNLTDRTMMNDILKNALVNKEYITAFCTAYDPDALDGKDKDFASKENDDKGEPILFKDHNGFTPYDKSGRYAPYWNKLGDNVDVEALAAIDTEDWYKVPKEGLHEYITDPYPYGLQGRTVMLASFVFPITHEGKFIGIISPDIVLDKLQEMVSKVNPREQGGFTEILSNAGAIVAHPDKQYLSKDLSEALVYVALTVERSKIKNAITLANEYLDANPVKDAKDEAEVTKFNNSKKFIENLKEFAISFDESKIDVSLLNADLATAMLHAYPQRLKYNNDVKESIQNGKSYVWEGEKYYTVYMPVRFSEVTNPWSVAVSIPIEKIMKTANGIRNYVALVSLISICVIAGILYVISGNITRPILELSDTAKILGEGNFDVAIPSVKSNYEIGTLSRAFRFMVDKINAQIKEMQQYAKTLEEKNTHLNRLNEMKDEFMANTSHELRTPLNGIIGIVESMIDGATGQLSDEQKYNLAIVSNSGKRLYNMINDILDYSKLKSREIELQIKPIDLKTIVDTVLVLSKPLVKDKELSLVNEIDSSLAVSADENRIQQILYNLIGNAIKFTEKGTVTLSAKTVKDMVAISVKDTGIGIRADKFDSIFESFEQADGSTAREYGGTGLGLSITKKIVELHGGTITVESMVGEGSTFTFTVPVSSVNADDIAICRTSKTVIDMENYANIDSTEGHDFDSAITGGACRILVVDDEPVNIQVLMNLLSVRHYSVTKAYNGIDALKLFDDGEEFDLVLLDVMMPKMSGYEVCKRLREKHSLFNLPIIMLTAKNQVQDIVMGFQSGANDYIQKPFDKDELLARAGTLLELKGAMTAAMAANKAKSLFLANMSHELRTPLNAVIGLSSLLLRTNMNDEQRDYTEKMRRASSTLLGIISNILDFSKADTGNMKLERNPFEVRQVFDDVAVFFKEQNANSPAANIPLNIELDKALPTTLLGDALRLQQVLINLVDNAYKFTENGAITVRANVVAQVKNEVTIDFAVEDTGIGIDQQKLEEIFAVFNQADNSSTRQYGGVGIGLTITREIVELMGGTIAVSSEKGRGTIFKFSCTFPIIDAVPMVKEADGEVSDPNKVLQGLRVLLVEDNKINALVATQLLQAVGVVVTGAVNGKVALEKLEEAKRSNADKPFDLVLMDLQMPVMDGYETTKIIKNNPEYSRIPVFALTAHALQEERDRCFALGMQDHLTKPIDVDMFYKTLREVAGVVRT
ncbi:MAG: response regulator [Planctomycetaceae bacterium]|jgi:signal transduction histidine kinase|nr:response regulator [Planctomycetaceae bacterium]